MSNTIKKSKRHTKTKLQDTEEQSFGNASPFLCVTYMHINALTLPLYNSGLVILLHRLNNFSIRYKFLSARL